MRQSRPSRRTCTNSTFTNPKMKWRKNKHRCRVTSMLSSWTWTCQSWMATRHANKSCCYTSSTMRGRWQRRNGRIAHSCLRTPIKTCRKLTSSRWGYKTRAISLNASRSWLHVPLFSTRKLATSAWWMASTKCSTFRSVKISLRRYSRRLTCETRNSLAAMATYLCSKTSCKHPTRHASRCNQLSNSLKTYHNPNWNP